MWSRNKKQEYWWLQNYSVPVTACSRETCATCFVSLHLQSGWKDAKTSAKTATVAQHTSLVCLSDNRAEVMFWDNMRLTKPKSHRDPWLQGKLENVGCSFPCFTIHQSPLEGGWHVLKTNPPHQPDELVRLIHHGSTLGVQWNFYIGVFIFLWHFQTIFFLKTSSFEAQTLHCVLSFLTAII